MKQFTCGTYLFAVLLFMPSLAIASFETGNLALDGLFVDLAGKDFSKKAQAIDALAGSDEPRRLELLKGLLDGSLRYLKKEQRIVWMRDVGGDRHALDVFNGEDLGKRSKRKFRKFSINNAIRTKISQLLASTELRSEDPEVRLAAVESMLNRGVGDRVDALRALLETETDERIRLAAQSALSVAALEASDPKARMNAIADVSVDPSPALQGRLRQMAETDDNDAVRAEAAAALRILEEKIRIYSLVETLFFGLSLGSVLVLAAIGLAITFGVMGVINMAHGELIMLGAYTTYLIQLLLPTATGLALIFSIPAAFIVSGMFGIAIERGVIRHLYGRPLETLLATFGVSLILQQLVRTGISAQNVAVENPEFMSGSWQINSVLSITNNRLYIFVFCLLVFAALLLFMRYSRLGLQMRAVSQNRKMARAMGVRSSRIDSMTFGLGSGVAGVAGVALSQLTNVGPNLGQSYIVDSFLVVVFGGVGNIWGTLVAGLSLGIGNKLLEPFAGTVLAKILLLVAIILFIQKRPRGLFPQKGRAAES